MISKTTSLPALLISAALLSASFATASFAEEATKPKAAVTESTKAAEQDAIKKLDAISDDGLAAVRGVTLARLAIFQGTPDQAKIILTTVKDDLDKALKDTPALLDKMKMAGAPADEIAEVQSGTLPVDMELGVVDDYKLTPEKAAHLKKANEHIQHGRKKEAQDELKLADVDLVITETTANLPAIDKDVDLALEQLGDSKYYDANLTLIKAEHMVTIRSNMPKDAMSADKKANPPAEAKPAADAAKSSDAAKKS
ncbi:MULTISPECIES: YfdX family protein [Brucella/Ochrobactrum group]|uniref:YfdX family protein n=1 Tax=Brucella/Ochrobactrum group TaxID=2826938 RepID=UPI00111F3F5C|nr:MULTISPECIES: YfdX family protein [Brucella/Ochrobactrum group]